jgi:hypothetical protein
VHLAAGQTPQQERIDGAEGQMAGGGERASAFDVVEQPGDLGGREIRIEQQAGLGRDGGLVARFLQPAAQVRRAAILPDYGAVNGLGGAPVPEQAGFALVGDADSGDIGCGQPSACEGLACRFHGRAPDVLRVVLDPAGGGVMLGELALRQAQDGEVGAEHDGAAGGGSLVECQDHCRFGHVSPFAPLAAGCIACNGSSLGPGLPPPQGRVSAQVRWMGFRADCRCATLRAEARPTCTCYRTVLVRRPQRRDGDQAEGEDNGKASGLGLACSQREHARC